MEAVAEAVTETVDEEMAENLSEEQVAELKQVGNIVSKTANPR